MNEDLRENEFGERVFQQLMDIWIKPAIVERQETENKPNFYYLNIS